MENDTDTIRLMKQNMRRMAGMAIFAVVVTVVLVFAMTAAWYSNIIHADSLVFTADSWDFTFEGDVVVADEAKEAAPGMSGIVPLSIENDNETPISVGVTIDKTLLSKEMKQRIFFYVDEQTTVNEEIVEKNYVNMIDSYSYPVMPGEQLTINEEYSNAPVLKWEWVHEVLGYYVQATVSEDESVEIVIEEYLRPVEYDTSKAIYDNETGKLVSVNNVARADFLKELTDKDGYLGNNGSSVNSYYPIAVDENGYGVWLYLCTKDEIDAANARDTEIGLTADEADPIQVRMYLTGENYVQESISVGSEAEIQSKLQATGSSFLKLTGDTTIQEMINIPAESDITLDLNESTLYLASEKAAFDVEPDGSLTILNGTIAFEETITEKPDNLIVSRGSEITLNNVNVSGLVNAIRIEDELAEGQDSRVRISNCNLESSEVSLLIRGNANASGRKTEVVIEDSTIHSTDYVAIMGNGNAGLEGCWGTNISVIGSTVTGKWGGIYHPQQKSMLYIENSTVSGYTGIAVKGGTVNIVDSQIRGTGEKQEPAFSTSGYTDTGDAIYVETNYENAVEITISQKDEINSATTITSTYGYAIQVYEPDAPQVEINLLGGTYSSDVSEFAEEGYDCVTIVQDKEYEVHASAASAGVSEELPV